MNIRIFLTLSSLIFAVPVLSKFNITLSDDDEKVILNNTIQPVFQLFEDGPSMCQPNLQYIDNYSKNYQTFSIISSLFLTVTISPTIDSELHSGFKFATPTETLNIASGTVSKFNITYNCDSAGEEAWGKLGLRVTAFEILSQKTTTYEFTYTKICSASGLQWFDASYVVVMMVSFLFVIFFSNENVQEDFVNRDTRFSPLHIVLFFGAGTSFMIIIVLLREFMIGFMMLAFLLCSASATFLFFQWFTLQVLGPESRYRRVGRYISLSELYSWLFSITVVGGWLVFKDWITSDLIALSILFVVLRFVQVKKFTMLLFITIFFFMFDLIWSFLGPASPEQNISTFSRNLAFPLKVMLPKIVPGVATKCAEMGIGDVILPGLCYKLMKVFEREHAQNSALSLSVLIGYFFGLSCCIFSMIFWNQVQPVNLFVIPFVLIGILGAATGSGNIMTLAKFSQGQDLAQMQMFAPQEDFEAAERNIRLQNENQNLIQ